jgi:hypothetical protein
MEDLNDVASRFEQVERHLASCEQAVAADKAGRRGSWGRRVVDFLFDTAPEKAFEAAQEGMAGVRSEAAAAVTSTVSAAAMRYLSTAADDVARRAIQLDRLRSARKMERKAQHVVALATTARDAFGQAVEACSSASSMELMDTFSNNKGISAMSSMRNSSAREAVDEAQKALANLRAAIDAASSVNARVDMPDDFLDLVLDFALDLPFDFLSWSNKAKLDAAEEQCNEAKGAIESVMARLRTNLEQMREVASREERALALIERPYIEQAARPVPTSLRFAIPETMETLSL